MSDIVARIVVIKRNGTDGSQFPLRSNKCLFGRKPDCDIRIQLPNVSQEHAVVKVDDDEKISITNLSSCNPTLVNGKPVSQVKIQHLDVLTISDRSFRFEFPSSVQKQERSLKSPHQQSSTSATTSQRKKALTMPTTKGSPRTPPTGRTLKENIWVLRRHSMPLQEEDEEGLESQAIFKTPLSSVDVNVAPKKESDMQQGSEWKTEEVNKTKSRSKRVSFGPVLSPEQFDKDLPPTTPVRRGGTPKRPSISGDNLIMTSSLSAKKRRTVAALPCADSITEEEIDGKDTLKNEPSSTPGLSQSSQEREFGESKQPAETSFIFKESEIDEMQESTHQVNTPTRNRRSSLRLAAKHANFPELQPAPEAHSQTVSPHHIEEKDETILESDDYTSDEDGDNREGWCNDENNECAYSEMLGMRKEIAEGIQLGQTKKKMNTPQRIQTSGGIHLRKPKKKMNTPLRKEIAAGIQLRQTKMKMATPLRKEIADGIQLRQTKKKIATPLRKEIAGGIQLRQTKKKIATPLRKEIADGIQLRQTKKKIATPLRKEIADGIKLRQTKKKIATPLRKEIADGIQLRQTKMKMATPLKKEIADGIQLRQTQKKIATPLRKEIADGIQLRQTKRKVPTPLRKEIAKGKQLTKVHKKLKTPVRRTTERGFALRATKQTMPLDLQIEIIKGKKLKSTKKTLPTSVGKAINSCVQLKKTEMTLPTPVKRQIDDGSTLKQTKRSSKRKRSEGEAPLTSQPKKMKLSPHHETNRKVRPALKTTLRRAIAMRPKLRPTRHCLASPIRKHIHSKPTLRAIRRKSSAATATKKTMSRKPTYAEIVKRAKKTCVKREVTKAKPSSDQITSVAAVAKSAALQNEQKEPGDSCKSTITPQRKGSSSWMSSLARAVNGVKIRETRIEDLLGVAEMFQTPPAAQLHAESSSKKQKVGNWLSALAKAANGRRKRGSPVEDLAGISGMFSTPPCVNRVEQNAPTEDTILTVSPCEEELDTREAMNPMKKSSLRRPGKSTGAVERATAIHTTSREMLEMVQPLVFSKTPSLRHVAEEVVSIQIVSPIQVSRTPSLRPAMIQPSVPANQGTDLHQLQFLPSIEPSKTPSLRSSDEVKTVSRKSIRNLKNRRKSLRRQGIKHLMKSPKHKNAVEKCEDLFVPNVFESPKQQPKPCLRKCEGLRGTPEEKDKEEATASPKLDGIKEMMQTRDLPSPNFVGLRVLMKTPKSSQIVDPEEFFSTELFAAVEGDSSIVKDDLCGVISEPVVDLTSLGHKASAVDQQVATAVRPLKRVIRAKRAATKGLTEPLPKRPRRTRSVTKTEAEDNPHAVSHPQTLQKKQTSRGKGNSWTTPSEPSSKSVTQKVTKTRSTTSTKPESRRNRVTPVKTRSTRRGGIQEAFSLDCASRSFEVPSPMKTRATHIHFAVRDLDRSTTEIATRRSQRTRSNPVKEDESVLEKTESKRETRCSDNPENSGHFTHSMKTRSHVVRGTKEEQEGSGLEETKLTQSTGDKNPLQESDNTKTSRRMTRSRHGETPPLEEDGGAEQGICSVEETKSSRNKRIKRSLRTKGKTRCSYTESVALLEGGEVGIRGDRRTRNSRRKDTLELSDNSKTRTTRRRQSGMLTVEEDGKTHLESYVLKEAKSTRNSRGKTAIGKGNDSIATKKTRSSHGESTALADDVNIEHENSTVRAKRQLRGKASLQSQGNRSKGITKPAELEEEGKITIPTTRGTKRKHQEDTSISAAPELKRTTRSSARLQNKPGSRK